jgi:hypothetical protein
MQNYGNLLAGVEEMSNDLPGVSSKDSLDHSPDGALSGLWSLYLSCQMRTQKVKVQCRLSVFHFMADRRFFACPDQDNLL